MSDTMIGRYQIVREIGRGGMAVVYLARDPSVNRQVAVKVLPRQFTFDPMFRERFRREAEVIATLEHSCIVPMYDFGEFDEQPFIVMRYMSGGSLVDRLRKGPLHMSEIQRIVDRVGSALDEAHLNHIVHRDLKPGNLLFDQRGDAFLSDFGIVKMGEAGASLTGSGIVGTPAYMSPEQAQGIKDIDGRADIYALGIIFYEMLTGQPPYAADTPMRLVVKHILEPVPQLTDVRDDLPTGFQFVLDHCLAKDPNARYQTGKLFSSDLQTAVSGEDVGDPGTQTIKGVQAALGGAQRTFPAGPLGRQPTTRAGAAPAPATVSGPGRGLWIGLGAAALVVAVGAGLAFSGIFGGKPTPTPTPGSPSVTATVDSLAQGFAQTITAQAAILGAPTSTLPPDDTPTVTVTATAAATGGTRPPLDTPAPRATFTFVPSAAPATNTSAAATSTPAQAGGSCSFTCPGGMGLSGACDPDGSGWCSAAVGHCEQDSDCSLFCPTTWPGLQLSWYCKTGVDAQGKKAPGPCICSVKLP